MSGYSLTHLADTKLAQDLRAGVADDRIGLAKRLAQLAEFDHRRLFLPTYPSMYRYCLGELGYSEDEACKRINVARAARRYPAIFASIAAGRHNLSTADMLVQHLLSETAGELISASAGMTKSELSHLLAERYPKADLPTIIRPLGSLASAPAPVGGEEPMSIDVGAVPAGMGAIAAPGSEPALSVPERIDGCVCAPAGPTSAPPPPRPRVAPLAPERYAIQVTVSKATHDKLRQAQALLSHALPSGDVAEVLDRALDVLIVQLEKRRYGATDRPSSRPQQASRNPRHIAARVRRAVRRRDGDQCTHVDDKGRRCRERKFLQFDHVVPVARGGESTVSNLQLKCAAHNRHAAEQTYGAGFMGHRRAGARESRASGLSADRPAPAP